jgi:hypothetical protein
VAVDHVEVTGPREHHPQLSCELYREQVANVGTVPHRPLDDRHQPRRRPGVAAGEQRDLVTTAHQLIAQVCYDAFRPPVAPRRHRFEEGSNLSDPHWQFHDMQYDCQDASAVRESA